MLNLEREGEGGRDGTYSSREGGWCEGRSREAIYSSTALLER